MRLFIKSGSRELVIENILNGENPLIGEAIIRLVGRSKVKTVSEVDVAAVESINAYVEMFVTENRLEQMLDVMVREKLLPFEMKSMGDFIRMVFNDCIKESQDEIVKNQLDVKKLGGPIANVARRWFINKYNSTN